VDGHPPDESSDDGTGEPPSIPSGEGDSRPDAPPEPDSPSGSHHDGEAPPSEQGEPSPATAEETQEDPAATAKDRTDDTPPVTANTPSAPEAPSPSPAGTGPSTPDTTGAPGAPTAPAAQQPGPEQPRTEQPVPEAGQPAGETSAPADGAETAGPNGADDAADSDATVVLGGAGTAAHPPPPAPRLSPDAVAASTSTRTTDPHGMRAVRARITPPAGTTRVGEGEAGEPAPRHFRSGAAAEEGERRRPTALLAAAPVLIVILLILGWAVDSAALSGQVMRNVEVSGRPVGGLGEASLPEVMSEIADDAAAREVQIVNGEQTYETTAGAIGLTVDEEATAEAALDAGRKDSLLVRPFKWLGSFFGSRDVPIRYTVSEGTAALALAQLQGGDATAPQEPTVALDPNSGEFTVTPGQTGTGINAEQVAADLPEAADQDRSGAIVIEADTAPVQPQISDEQARELADEANAMTAEPLTLKVRDTTVQVQPAQLRSWINPPTPDRFELTANGERIAQDLPGLFEGLPEPQNATWELGPNGRPRVVEARDGLTCCNDNSPARVWEAIVNREGAGEPLELETHVTEPEVTTEEAQSWRIAEPVGGNRAWQNGQAVPGPSPGFTTYFTAGEPRVTNIHRIADLVNGAVIPPDGTFSVNEHVGPRTPDNGFVEAGAIRDGAHVTEVGGGVSQFATTTFNAAYFAGLDIVEYQAHSEWFSRYPRGREATMGHPAPDLKIHNNTPYGIMIRTSHTATSVTVTLWSTPYITAEQTGISESPAGVGCTTVTTTRTRTWLDDRHTETDTFRATYRNVADINCQGQPIVPPPEDEQQPGR
jgi:vancomycin resistance protein YoaR